MKIVYIAGPFRGPSHWAIHQNISEAMALALEVWKLGAAAICPHGNTFCLQDTCTDEVFKQGDLWILSRCDAILMTARWKESEGAIGEHEYAIQRGIPVFYTIASLHQWLQFEEDAEDGVYDDGD